MFNFSLFEEVINTINPFSSPKSAEELEEEKRKLRREQVEHERQKETELGRLVSKFYKLWDSEQYIEAIALFNSSALNTIDLLYKHPNEESSEQPYEIKLIFFNLMCYYLNKNDISKAYQLLGKFEPIKETPMGKLAFGVYLFTLPKPDKSQALEYL